MEVILAHYYDIAAVILFGIGFFTLLLHRNLIKKIIGLNIMDTSIFLFLASKGYIFGRVAPIVQEGVTNAEAYICLLYTSCTDVLIYLEGVWL